MTDDERQQQRSRRAVVEALALSQSSGAKELAATLREMTESVARCLAVERVSVWRFTDADDALVCVDLFELGSEQHSHGAVLRRDDYPAYFDSLSDQRAVVVVDAHTHQATREFSANYLAPNSIMSMLDAPIRVDGRLYGVLCHEQVGDKRAWTEDEVEFAGSVADLASLAVTTDRLRQSEELLQLALDAGDVGTFIWYPTSDKLAWDERTHRIFDWPPEMFTGQLSDFADRVHPEDASRVDAAIRESIATGKFFQIELRIVHRCGAIRVVEGRGHPVYKPNGDIDHFSGACFDVTERRQIERRAYETQKLESLGLLAGGIAHDFNNLLVGVLGNASLIQLEQVKSPTARQALEGIQSAATQAGNLCRQLLAYSGQGSVVVEPLAINELLAQTAGLVRSSIKQGVSVVTDLAEDLPSVEADATQLQQVVMNLIINASEAMTSEGTVTVATRRATAADRAARPSSERLDAGEHLLLSVADDGPGIAPEVVERIFDPFFSTKAPGRGLGLAAVQGIIGSHRGVLRVSSELGSGTCFEVLLPFSDAPAKDVHEPAESPHPAADAPVALLVDDEPMVRRVGTAVLEQFGYEVDVAPGASEALELFSKDPSRYRVGVLDLTLAGRDGLSLARELRALREDIPILIASGFAREAVGTQLAGLGRARFLQKPYTAHGLMAAIEAVVADDTRTDAQHR